MILEKCLCMLKYSRLQCDIMERAPDCIRNPKFKSRNCCFHNLSLITFINTASVYPSVKWESNCFRGLLKIKWDNACRTIIEHVYLEICFIFCQFNFVGKILGPQGNTIKRLQEETGAKISVLGKGSMRDKAKVSLH